MQRCFRIDKLMKHIKSNHAACLPSEGKLLRMGYTTTRADDGPNNPNIPGLSSADDDPNVPEMTVGDVVRDSPGLSVGIVA